MSDSVPPFLTPGEAAQLLRLSPSTLATWRCRRSDGPPFTKLSWRKVLYPRAELLAWAESHGLQTVADPRPPRKSEQDGGVAK